MESKHNPENCVICSIGLDSNKISIYKQNPDNGKRLLIKIFEVTKVDFLDGSLCSKCYKIISLIENLETEFNSILKDNVPKDNISSNLIRSAKNVDSISNEIEEEENDRKIEIKQTENNIKVESNTVPVFDLDSLMDEIDPNEIKPIINQEDEKEKCDLVEKEPEFQDAFMSESHTNDENKSSNQQEKFECIGCDEVFRENWQLGKHLEEENKKGNPHGRKCNQCGELFHKSVDLKKHINAMHEGQLKYNCKYCKETFTDYRMYRSHGIIGTNQCTKKEEAFKDKKRICPTCAKTFVGDSSLERHVQNMHEIMGIFTCNECGKVVTNPSKLKAHMLKVHDPVTCEQCGKICQSKSYYDTHWMNHHTKMEDRPYQCTVCDKGFLDRRALSYHMNIHTGERPFKCKFEECGKPFPDPSTLIQHEKRVHLGIRMTKKKQLELLNSENPVVMKT